MHRSHTLGKRPHRSCVLRPFISEGISLLGRPWHERRGQRVRAFAPGSAG